MATFKRVMFGNFSRRENVIYLLNVVGCGIPAILFFFYRPLQSSEIPIVIYLSIMVVALGRQVVAAREGQWRFDALILVSAGLLLPGPGQMIVIMATFAQYLYAQRDYSKRPMLINLASGSQPFLYHGIAAIISSQLAPLGDFHLVFAVLIYFPIGISLNYILTGLTYSLALGVPVIKLWRENLSLMAMRWDSLTYLGGAPLAALLTLPSGFILGTLIVAFVWAVRSVAKAHVQIEQLSEDVMKDNLTGLLNRRGLDDLNDSISARNDHFALAMLDLDHFKQINDLFGHERGDEVLRQAGAAIRDVVREADFAARFGGEEFCVLLPGANVDAALSVTNRIRQRLRALPLRPDGIEVTLSAGVTGWHDGGMRQMLLIADQALYEAKAAGRDQVIVASEG